MESIFIKCLSSTDIRIIVFENQQLVPVHYYKENQGNWMISIGNMNDFEIEKTLPHLLVRIFADEHAKKRF